MLSPLLFPLVGFPDLVNLLDLELVLLRDRIVLEHHVNGEFVIFAALADVFDLDFLESAVGISFLFRGFDVLDN